MNNKLYGSLPTDLGLVGEDINCDEMMYYLYLPIKLKGSRTEIVGDERLEKFQPLLDRVFADSNPPGVRDWYTNRYVYLTAKTVYVSPGCLSNRPGWHSDGFMTDDVNYIWYTDVPTVFWDTKGGLYSLPQDHELSMIQMSELAEHVGDRVKYPSRHLLRLDESVIHKTDDKSSFTGVRTFVKISVSEHIYALKGNSINPHLPLGVEYKDRKITRNCPTGG